MEQEYQNQANQVRILLPGEKLNIQLQENIKINPKCVIVDNKNKQMSAKLGGALIENLKKEKILIDILNISNKYYPQKEDFVIGMIKNKTGELYVLDIGAPTDATLSFFDFEGATKKNRPNLEIGQLVYCKVVENNKYLRTKVSCINPKSKKEWTSGEAFFGELQGGLSQYVGIQLSKKLLNTKQQGDYILQYLQKYAKFEIAVGVNGRNSLTLEGPQIEQLVDQVMIQIIK